MASRQMSPHGEDYFNDLSKTLSRHSTLSDSPPEHQYDGGEAGPARPKRIACIICRKRKLKCDGTKPSCGTCSRLSHKCAYDEVRRKSGPKRGYVKELEARLAQVETQLKSKDRPQSITGGISPRFPSPSHQTIPQPGFQLNGMDIGIGDQDILTGDMRLPPAEPVSWEMVSLGLEEPLPPLELMDELHQIYFERIQPCIPMIHKYRYYAAMNLAVNMRPPICLRYAMWALACSVTDKYLNHQEIFYQRARKYAELDEMKGHGQAFMTVGHSQCWNLISTYEFKNMYFPRAWMSIGRCVRLTQMMGLHRLDGSGLEVKQCIPPPRDWTDSEERRRTFWMAYCGDRYASIGTGWPMTIEEKDILTNLPATEEAFEKSQAQQTSSLSDAMTTEGASSLSSFAGVVLMACLFGRNLTHLHRPDPNDRPEDTAQGEFWKRHHYMESILLNTAMFLPAHLRLPAGIRDSNIVFLNMNIHTSTICLHQAAVLKAEKHRLGANLINHSIQRCYLAASEIVGIMRMVSHMELAYMNPFVSFCLYVAARVYVQTFKKRTDDEEVRRSLEFLLNAMQAIRKKNALTESFLVQLSVDLEGSGLDTLLTNPRYPFGLKKHYSRSSYEPQQACSSIVDIREPATTYQPMYDHSSSSGSFHTLHSSRGATSEMGQVHSTQYSMAGFSVPTREHRSPQPNDPSTSTASNHTPGILPGQGWGESLPGGSDTSILGSNNFDTEMSDRMADRRRSVSNHPTPPRSLHSSSNSYSPPNLEEIESQDLSRHPPDQPTPGSFFHQSATFPGYGSSSSSKYLPPPNARIDDNNFVMSSGWEIGASGVIPSVPAGMSPVGGEGAWTQMLDGMAWDGSAIGPAEVPWITTSAQRS